MNEKFEKYIEGLSPELQEKARACKTKEELNAFIADNGLELPEDALELVSGGCGTSTPVPDKCNKCNAKVTQCSGSEDFWDCLCYDGKRWGIGDGAFKIIIGDHYRCPNCGIVFKDEIHA